MTFGAAVLNGTVLRRLIGLSIGDLRKKPAKRFAIHLQPKEGVAIADGEDVDTGTSIAEAVVQADFTNRVLTASPLDATGERLLRACVEQHFDAYFIGQRLSHGNHSYKVDTPLRNLS
jgi:hypothetical protein